MGKLKQLVELLKNRYKEVGLFAGLLLLLKISICAVTSALFGICIILPF